MDWVELQAASSRWEAELVQQLLAGYDIPTRFRDVGMTAYFGSGAATTVLVRARDLVEARQIMAATPADAIEEGELDVDA
ncbi:MAG: DUF2007 domain-containing protein [Cyanobacteria bacterium J06648_11]